MYFGFQQRIIFGFQQSIIILLKNLRKIPHHLENATLLNILLTFSSFRTMLALAAAMASSWSSMVWSNSRSCACKGSNSELVILQNKGHRQTI